MRPDVYRVWPCAVICRYPRFTGCSGEHNLDAEPLNLTVNVIRNHNLSAKVIERADKICVAVHGVAWLVSSVTWGAKWWRDGPAPSGPLYNGAKHFIGRLDIVVEANTQDLTIKVGQIASSWFSADLGASFTVAFGCMILLAGTLQWFLLGRLVQWLAARQGRRLALVVLCLYAVWAMFSLFLWVAA